MRTRAHRWLISVLFLAVAAGAAAGPYAAAGDLALRHDIQLLADNGVLRGPVTTWPIAWGPVLDDLRDTDIARLSPRVQASFDRVLSRASWEARSRQLTVSAKAGVADNRSRIRSYQNTPRGKLEVGAGVAWLGEWANVELNIQGADDQFDDHDVRADDSMLGVVVGNWSVSVSTQQRWWGPGWDGSLILSNNARPIPSLVVDRLFTDAFETRWLRWIGPWDLNLMFGQLEERRAVADARFFGVRFNFRPLESLEIGLSRSAQWCGEGRPCDLSTLGDLLIGRDNLGDDSVNTDNEPGNQLAGVDFRWTPTIVARRIAFYGQFVGEDEAGGFPSRWIGQLGGEWSGQLMQRWSTRLFAEFAGTSCQFYESSELFNCAYNHSIYQTGYRFRSRAIGHGVDNDARIASVGLIAVNDEETQWRALLRFAKLNRGGVPDSRNSLSPTPQDLWSVDLAHSRVIPVGVAEIGVGYQSVDDAMTGTTNSDARVYLQWRSSY